MKGYIMFSIFKEPIGFSATILSYSEESLAKIFKSHLHRNYRIDGYPWEGNVVFYDNNVRYLVNFTFSNRKDSYVNRVEVLYYYVSISKRISGNYIGSIRSIDISSREVRSHLLNSFWLFQRTETQNELDRIEKEKLKSTEVIRKYS